MIVVYITGCSAGEQYSHRLFSKVLLGAQVGGGERQATVWAREGTQTRNRLTGYGPGRDSEICWDSKRAIH
jgi:hypothetical protein